MKPDPRSGESLNQLWQKACTMARRKGFPMEAEDFGSFAVEEHLKGRVNAYLGILWVDYVRHRFGNRKSKTNALRTSEQTAWTQVVMDTPDEDLKGAPWHCPATVAQDGMAELLDLCQMPDPDHTRIAIMIGVLGMTLQEVGDAFGVSTAWIAYLLANKIGPQIRLRVRA